MKKKRALLIVAAVLLAAILIAFLFFRETEIRFSGTALINGKELSEPVTLRLFPFQICQEAILPLVKTYECLGYRAEWESDSVCRIENEEEAFILDLAAHTFISMKGKREGENLLMPAPGETHGVIRIAEREVYVNLGIFRGMRMRLGARTHVDIDYWHRTLVLEVGKEA